MSPPRPSPAKFSVTCGLASMLRTRAPGMLHMATDSAPSHTNHTGLGGGVPRGVTVVSHTTMSSRRWRATRAPNSVASSITTRSYARPRPRSSRDTLATTVAEFEQAEAVPEAGVAPPAAPGAPPPIAPPGLAAVLGLPPTAGHPAGDPPMGGGGGRAAG